MKRRKGFEMTEKQAEAWQMLGGFPPTMLAHVLLEGGSRSAKTFTLLYAIATRALKAANSSHAVLRFRFNHLIASVLEDTWPKMLDLCYPGVRERLKQDRSLRFVDEFPNGARVWWGGLDDKARTEKVLGQEHATVFLNECSQIPWDARGIVVTRVAQTVLTTDTPSKGHPLPLRMYYDCNPPTRGHWLYKLFHEHVDPTTGREIQNPQAYAVLKMNPMDNAKNLSKAYLDELRALPEHLRRRFFEGEYGDDNPNALFKQEHIDRWRFDGDSLPKMQRIVIGVDPSGASDDPGETNDDIGIVVVGLGLDGNAYVLEDLTINAGPATWGKVAVMAYVRHRADLIAGEKNFGGEMVRFTIQAAAAADGAHARYKHVTSSRGKVLRAEPIAGLYETGKVRHVGEFRDMETELCAFSTTGYTGQRSPNRADALVFAITELFPGLTRIVTDLTTGQRGTMGGYVFEDDDSGGVESWKVA